MFWESRPVNPLAGCQDATLPSFSGLDLSPLELVDGTGERVVLRRGLIFSVQKMGA